MLSDSEHHGDKNVGPTDTAPDTGSITNMGDVNTDMTERTTNAPFLEADVARKVFNTLLEMILINLPIKTLSRALSVSRHCRDVITSNRQLRQTLFLEGIPVSEYLITTGFKHKTTTISGPPRRIHDRLLAIAQGPRKVNQGDRIIVKAHPALHALPKFHYALRTVEFDLPSCRTQGLFCDTIKKLPANTLLFQPPVTNIVMYHHGSKLWLKCSEGATFGMIARQLEKQSSPYFRKKGKQGAEDVDDDKVPGTQNIEAARARAARKFYVQRDRNCHLSLGAPCLYLEAEGAKGNDCEVVRNTRLNMVVHREFDRSLE